jgi:hypothetical protein
MIEQDEWTQPDPSLYPIIARLDPDEIGFDLPELPRKQATGWTFVQLAPAEPGYLFPTYEGAGSPCVGGPQNRRPEPGVIPGVLHCVTGAWWYLWQESEIDYRIGPTPDGITKRSLLALVDTRVCRTDSYRVLSDAETDEVLGWLAAGDEGEPDEAPAWENLADIVDALSDMMKLVTNLQERVERLEEGRPASTWVTRKPRGGSDG